MAEKEIPTNRLDGPDFDLPVYSPVCLKCRHLDADAFMKGERRCGAFTQIPDEIWKGENDHTKPYPGDHGIRFSPIERGK